MCMWSWQIRIFFQIREINRTNMLKPPKTVIISTGRELLTGRVMDSNSHFLAGRLFDLGWKVLRSCQVDDDFNAVCAVIKQALADNVDMVITTGGLGPTYDDGTLGYIGKCLGLPIESNPQAKEMVRQRYSEIAKTGVIKADDFNRARMKMAMLPRNGLPLQNTVGTAPGLFLRHENHMVFCLPGPPREMQAMFENHVVPMIKAPAKGRRFFRQVLTIGQPDESVLDPLIARARKQFPGVYFKTTPKGFTHPVMDVFMETWDMQEKAEETLKQAAIFLQKLSKPDMER